MKEIWKKHYEKIVLGVLAFSFILALLYLLQMIDSASETTEEQLRFRKSKANYEIKDFKAEEYQVDYNLGKQTVLKVRGEEDAKADKSAKDNKSAKAVKKGDLQKNEYSFGLLVPAKMLRCKCKTILPWEMARSKNQQNAICPNCNEEMEDPKDPPATDDGSEYRNRDSDGDTLPDRFERRLGLNPNDPQDAQNDKDGDGFSNAYEFHCKTSIDDKSSYPSLRQCLSLKDLKKKELGVKLDSVMLDNDINDPSKKVWSISLIVNRNYEYKTVGDMITINKKQYKIHAVDEKSLEKQEGGVVNKYIEYNVVLVPVNNNVPDLKKQIVLKRNEKVYDLEPKPVIFDVRTGKEVKIKANNSFEIVGEDGKKVMFQVISADAKAETATLADSSAFTFVLKKLTKKEFDNLANAYKKAGTGESDMSAPTEKSRGKGRNKGRNRNRR